MSKFEFLGPVVHSVSNVRFGCYFCGRDSHRTTKAAYQVYMGYTSVYCCKAHLKMAKRFMTATVSKKYESL